ncbi:MAG TPA: CRISPR-associated ring nuclease Crn3/Csx3 [Candidatus Bipolaricaulota bacterium]|nr:CRISPR-associated ring nuclease Crn3/Csx3 [Candidatus Bipolaricaulota bacterium]
MKVIVCGPPHSGKSVFVANLRRFLPREGSFLFRCAPDGEGTWSNKADQELVSRIRRKGKFDSKFMDYVLNGLENCHIPITLVDVGGIRSEQNEAIFAKCDAFIVLSSKDEELSEWQRFGEALGLKCLALLRSRLVGSEEIENVQADAPIAGTICGLERGTEIDSELLRQIAQRLTTITASELAKYEEEKDMSENTTITTAQIADTLGKGVIEKTLPNGRVIKTIDWTGDDLAGLDEHLRSRGFGRADHVVFDGPMPAWMGLALVHGVHPAFSSLNDPRLGAVGIGMTNPDGEGAGPNLKFSVEDKGGYMLLTFEIEGVTFAVADLDKVVPPAIPEQKGLVISGRGPNWLAVSLALAYHAKAKWVAMFQPGVGATVAMSHDPDTVLGSVIQITL